MVAAQNTSCETRVMKVALGTGTFKSGAYVAKIANSICRRLGFFLSFFLFCFFLLVCFFSALIYNWQEKQECQS